MSVVVQRPPVRPEGQATAPLARCPQCWARWDVIRTLRDANETMGILEEVVVCKTGHAFWFVRDNGTKPHTFQVLKNAKGLPLQVEYATE